MPAAWSPKRRRASVRIYSASWSGLGWGGGIETTFRLSPAWETAKPRAVEYYRLVGPALGLLDPETAHRLTLRALAAGLVPAACDADSPRLAVSVWGRRFANPVGLAAGFDKDASAVTRLLGLGFGFVEAGTVTPRPQPGNPRPRVFRLRRDRAVINRLGFNSRGLDAFAARLATRPPSPGVVGANLGANRGSPDPIEDFAIGFRAVMELVDYVAVNVSSPNTPGLRDLQRRDPLARLLDTLVAVRAEAGGPAVPILVKIAPDLGDEEVAAIAEIVLDKQIDGMIVANSTIARGAALRGRHRRQAGGLSGAPLMAPSTALLAATYRLTGGRIPLVGVGGIASGADAYTKIRAGASLVQLYTALVYEGPGLISRIKSELGACLARDGFGHVAAAVGADAAGV